MKTFVITMLVLHLFSFALNLVVMGLGNEAKKKVNPISILTAAAISAWSAYLLIGGREMIAAITALAFACLVLAVPSCLFLAVWMFAHAFARGLNEDQRRQYRSAPKWLEGDRK